jgi:hypothetical protein
MSLQDNFNLFDLLVSAHKLWALTFFISYKFLLIVKRNAPFVSLLIKNYINLFSPFLS